MFSFNIYKSSPPSIFTCTLLLLSFITQLLAAQIQQPPVNPLPQIQSILTADIVILGIFFIVTGLGFCFYGARLFRVCLFIAGGYLLAVLSIALVGRFQPEQGFSNPQLVFGLTAAIAALIGGFLFLTFYRIGCFGIGALGGYSLALFLLTLKSGGLVAGKWEQFAFVFAFAVVGGVAALYIEPHAVRISTAIGGSYLTIIGIDVFAKYGFAHAARQFISNPSLRFETSTELYAMAGAFVVLAVAGIYVQYTQTARHYSGSRSLKL